MSSARRRLLSRVGLASAALLAIGIPAGCGGSSSSTSTAGSQSATAPAASATGASATGTAAASAKTPAPAKPGTASTTAGSTSTPTASPAPKGRLLHRYAGYGNGRLGTLVTSGQTLLVWNAGHPRIQIFTSKGFMLVNSSSHTGTVRLSRGTYRGVRVSSPAQWSVELRSPAS
jgi:hypothetical protein